MPTRIFHSQNLALGASLSESGTDDETILPGEFLLKVLVGEKFRVDERDVHLAMVVGGGM